MDQHLALWLMFFDGMLAAWFLRAACVIRSDKNDYSGYGQYLGKNLAYFTGRWFFAGCLFQLWTRSPDYFTNQTIGIRIPLVLGTAGMFGYLIDSVLDKILPLAGNMIVGVISKLSAAIGNGSTGKNGAKNGTA